MSYKTSKFLSMNRNQIILVASRLQAKFRFESEVSQFDGFPRRSLGLSRSESIAQQLSNDACESRFTLRELRHLLVDLDKEACS